MIVHNSIYIFIISGLALIIGLSCVKKRDEYFAQGQGKNLYDIKQFENKRDWLQTKTFKRSPNKKEIQRVQVSAASDLKVGRNNRFLNNVMNLVDYDTNSEIVKMYGKLDVVGVENKKYDIVYEFTDKNLLVKKIAPADEIPYYEKRAAKVVNEFRPDRRGLKESIKLQKDTKIYSVILLGCPVTYVSVENQLNRNLERTKQLIEIPVKSPNEATHFKMDEKKCTEFAYGPQADVVRADLFEGEWYFAETIVKTEDKWNSLVGWEVAQDFRSAKAQRVKFVKYENSIHAINQNVDARILDQDINKRSVVSFPVRAWHEFAIDPNNELREISLRDKYWKQRSFVELDLKSTYSATFPFSVDGSSVVAFEIDQDAEGNDYFSLTLQKPIPQSPDASQMMVKYAFLRAGPRNYEPRRYFRDDEKIFGFFPAVHDYIQNHENDRKGDLSKYYHISRFNPKKSVYEFRFSDISVRDPKIRKSAEKAVKAWETAFREAGLNIEFRLMLDPKYDVGLGDLRYNIINIVESVSTGSLVGVGPSIVDPFTGEIIAATANIQLTSIRGAYFRFLRNYIRSQLGIFNNNYLCLKNKAPAIPGTVEQIQAPEERECTRFETVAKYLIDEMKKNAVACSGVSRVIAKYKDRIRSHEDLLNQQSQWDSEEELKFIEPCVEVLSERMLVSSLVHELGHNLGLRHNFRGSSDFANYWSPEKTEGVLVEASSVMDYLSPFKPELQRPGKYDVAAILYGYAGKLLPKTAVNGDKIDLAKTVDLDSQHSIRENLESGKLGVNYNDFYKFDFCSDEDLNPVRRADPMCLQFDAGATPLDIVNHLIQRYELDYVLSNFKYDREYNTAGQILSGARTSDYYWKLRDFYDRWRLLVADRFSNDLYFERFGTVFNYEQQLRKWLAQDSQGEYGAKGYGPAALRVYDFFKQMFFMPDRHCVFQQKGKIALIKLNAIREAVRTKTSSHNFSPDSFIVSCQSPMAQSYLKEIGADGVRTSEGEKYHITEFGKEKSDAFYNVTRIADLETKKASQTNFDVIGLSWELEQLLPQGILMRELRNLIQQMKGLHPHLLDEPTNRRDMFTSLLDQVIYGILLEVEKDGDTVKSVKLVDSSSFDRLSALPANVVSFPTHMGSKELTLKYITDVIAGGYSITTIGDRYNAKRFTRISDAAESEFSVLAVSADNPPIELKSVTYKTQVDNEETTLYLVPPRYREAYLSNLVIGLHAKLRSDYHELESQYPDLRTRPPEVIERIGQLREKAAILELIFKPKAVGPHAPRR